MIIITPEDAEFLTYFEEEIQSIEELLLARQSEPNLRILAAKLRGTLHRTEGHLLRSHLIFKLETSLAILDEQPLYYAQALNSPAVMAVDFRAEITLAELTSFTETRCPKGTFAMAVPTMGFDPSRPPHFSDRNPSLSDYLDSPIVGIETTPVSRWQLLSYIANKKGIPHYSESREKQWQRLLDRYWRTIITSGRNKEYKIKAPYEMLLRISVEVLNSPRLDYIRFRAKQLLPQSMQP